jgi:hypothetical protein
MKRMKDKRLDIQNPVGHILEQEWLDSENGVKGIYKAVNDYPDDTDCGLVPKSEAYYQGHTF